MLDWIKRNADKIERAILITFNVSFLLLFMFLIIGFIQTFPLMIIYADLVIITLGPNNEWMYYAGNAIFIGVIAFGLYNIIYAVFHKGWCWYIHYLKKAIEEETANRWKRNIKRFLRFVIDNLEESERVFKDNKFRYSYSNRKGDLQNNGDGTGYFEKRGKRVEFTSNGMRELLALIRSVKEAKK